MYQTVLIGDAQIENSHQSEDIDEKCSTLIKYSSSINF